MNRVLLIFLAIAMGIVGYLWVRSESAPSYSADPTPAEDPVEGVPETPSSAPDSPSIASEMATEPATSPDAPAHRPVQVTPPIEHGYRTIQRDELHDVERAAIDGGDLFLRFDDGDLLFVNFDEGSANLDWDRRLLDLAEELLVASKRRWDTEKLALDALCDSGNLQAFPSLGEAQTYRQSSGRAKQHVHARDGQWFVIDDAALASIPVVGKTRQEVRDLQLGLRNHGVSGARVERYARREG